MCVHCGVLIDDPNITKEADKLYETYANVRPSCKQGRCGDHKATHPHKKLDKARKRKSILNFTNISVAFKGQIRVQLR